MEPTFEAAEAEALEGPLEYIDTALEPIAENVREFPFQIPRSDIFPIAITLLFFLGVFGGNWFIGNASCYPLLGCNAGIGGYDALLHVVSGVMEASLFIRFGFGLSFGSISKNVLSLVSLSAIASVSWEILEFLHDHIIVRFGLEHLLAFLKPYTLSQPTNADTMGDIVFALIASTAAAAIILSLRQRRRVDS